MLHKSNHRPQLNTHCGIFLSMVIYLAAQVDAKTVRSIYKLLLMPLVAALLFVESSTGNKPIQSKVIV